MGTGSLKPDHYNYNYNLINIDTGKVEASDLLPLRAKDEQNALWARGIKTKLVRGKLRAPLLLTETQIANLCR
jgi:hypothetical protein